MATTLEALIAVLADLNNWENTVKDKLKAGKWSDSRVAEELAVVKLKKLAIQVAIDREGDNYADLDELALQWAHKIDRHYQVEHIGGKAQRTAKVQTEIRELLRHLKP